MDKNYKKKLLIIGGKSTALEIYEVVLTCFENLYSEIIFVIGNNESVNDDFKYIKDFELEDYLSRNSCNYIISFANHSLRTKFEEIFNKFKINPVNVIHPSAIISSNSNIGKGNYIAAGSIISFNATVNNHNIINYNTTIGHDAYVGNHCIINPGARISGNVIIGDRVLIGTNSIIFQGLKVGNDCLIDALTYIDRDIDNNMICSSKQVKIFKRVI